MSTFTVRKARFSDIPELAALHAKAFWNDGFIGEFINPHREKYPQDFTNYFLRRQRVNIWQHNRIWMVSTATDDHGKEVIVGSAQWERLGDGGDRMKFGVFDRRSFWRAYYTAQAKFENTFWPNRATEGDREDTIERTYGYIGGVWSGERKESWFLELLAVLPEYQGKGIGKELVEWGLQRVEEENVTASVISADGKDGFYVKLGFTEKFGSAGMGEGNPLAGSDGGNMYWKMPTRGNKSIEA